MWSKTGEKAGGGKAKDSCREWQGSTRVEMTNIKGAVQVRWFTDKVRESRLRLCERADDRCWAYWMKGFRDGAAKQEEEGQ